MFIITKICPAQPAHWHLAQCSLPPRARGKLLKQLLAVLSRGNPCVQGFTVNSVPTKPIEGQKTGTSGLRKKTKVFMSENYLANWWGTGRAVGGAGAQAQARGKCRLLGMHSLPVWL